MLLRNNGEIEHTPAVSPSAISIEGSADPLLFDNKLLEHRLIEIRFANFADGRGYSAARYLRATLRYRGTLRASGAYVPDQLAYLYKVGFDEVWVDTALLHRHGNQDWLDAQRRCSAEAVAGTETYAENAVSGAASLWQQRRVLTR